MTCVQEIRALDDDLSQESIKRFYNELLLLVKENNIQAIGIKKRQQTGKFSGGALSFKMESLIQLLNLQVEIIPPATITKQTKKLEISDSIFKYQIDALKTAYTLLVKD